MDTPKIKTRTLTAADLDGLKEGESIECVHWFKGHVGGVQTFVEVRKGPGGRNVLLYIRKKLRREGGGISLLLSGSYSGSWIWGDGWVLDSEIKGRARLKDCVIVETE